MKIPQFKLFKPLHSFFCLSQHHNDVFQVSLLRNIRLCRCRRPDYITSEPDLQLWAYSLL